MPTTPLSIHKMRQDASARHHSVFDAGSGTTLADRSGNSQPGTFGAGAAAPTWITTGRLKDALLFDGAAQYVALSANATLYPSTITVAAWMYWLATTSYGMIVGSIDNATNTGYDFREVGATQTWQFQIGTGTAQKAATTPGTVSLNAWHWMVGTADGSNVRIYVDGALQATTASAGLAASTNVVRIGARVDGFFLNARIDDLLIRSGALTTDEIAAEFQRMTKVAMFA